MGTLVGAVPEELRTLQRWVCADEGSKRPLLCFGEGAASVSRPSTWGTYEMAARLVEAGEADYLGFVFAGDGFVGIDVDRAFGDDGMLTRDALDAVMACRSYTEVSKSGRGIHIICRGKLPFRGRNNREGWEVYEDGRYFVLTGRVVLFGEVAEAQAGIDLVLSRHFADGPREGGATSGGRRIWEHEWVSPPSPGMVRVEPDWPDVEAGSRHLSLVSYCGQLWSQGCPERQMMGLAMRQSERHLKPPLGSDEVEQVVRSVTRYRR